MQKFQPASLLCLRLLIAFLWIAGRCTASDVDSRYKGALETFYLYWETLNQNKISEKGISGLFGEQFCFVGNPTVSFSTIKETTAFYKSVRNEIYPAISSPFEFQSLKIYKLAYQPVTKDSVLLALIDVFHTTPNQRPRKAMCFAYNLVLDKEQRKWLLNSLINFSVGSFPSNWIQIEVEDRWAYWDGPLVEELQSILAADVTP